MTKQKRIALTLLFLLLTVLCYAVGFSKGAIFFVVCGMFFELLFWVGVFKKSDRKKDQ